MVLVTFTEFARIKGCSNAAVSHASKSRIADAVVMEDGRRWLDRDKALELWRVNTLRTHNSHHEEKPAKVVATKATPDKAEEEVAVAPPGDRPKDLARRIAQLPDDEIPDLNESRSRREHYQAELAKLQVDAQRGELVPAAEVKRAAFSLAKSVRESLINIPDRVASQFAAEADATAIHMALSHEITQALEALANAA